MFVYMVYVLLPLHHSQDAQYHYSNINTLTINILN